jgi:hypothetical protein
MNNWNNMLAWTLFSTWEDIAMNIIYRIVALSAAALCSELALAANLAQADVPFNFTVEGRSFPAGFYDISMESTRSVITLRSRANPAITTIKTVRPSGPAGAPVILKSHVVGGFHSLESIQMGLRSTSTLTLPQ